MSWRYELKILLRHDIRHKCHKCHFRKRFHRSPRGPTSPRASGTPRAAGNSVRWSSRWHLNENCKILMERHKCTSKVNLTYGGNLKVNFMEFHGIWWNFIHFLRKTWIELSFRRVSKAQPQLPEPRMATFRARELRTRGIAMVVRLSTVLLEHTMLSTSWSMLLSLFVT